MADSTKLPKSFGDMLQAAGKPVLVDFWAEWCGPCHALAPTLKDLAAEADGRFLIAKVNIDQQPELARQFNVQSIPTLILFDKDQILWRGMGAMPLHQLRSAVEGALK